MGQFILKPLIKIYENKPFAKIDKIKSLLQNLNTKLPKDYNLVMFFLFNTISMISVTASTYAQ